MENHINPPLKIVAICGSLRKGSYTNLALQIALQGASEAGAEIKLIDLWDYNLVFAGSMEEQEYPEDVFKLRNEVGQANGIILGSPEYHGSISGCLKNALDLMSYEEFEGKIVGLVGVAGGQMGATNALNSMCTISRNLQAWVLPRQVSIPESHKAFDGQGGIQIKNIENRLLDMGRQIVKFVSLHQNNYMPGINQIVERIAV